MTLSETVTEFEQRSFDVRKTVRLCPKFFLRRFLKERKTGTMYPAPIRGGNRTG